MQWRDSAMRIEVVIGRSAEGEERVLRISHDFRSIPMHSIAWNPEPSSPNYGFYGDESELKWVYY